MACSSMPGTSAGHDPIELTLTTTCGPHGRRFHTIAHDLTITILAQRFAAAQAAVSHGLADTDGSSQAADRVVRPADPDG